MNEADRKQAHEMFAAFALSGLLANGDRYRHLVITQGETIDSFIKNSARKAIEAADEMMEQLNEDAK